jgi:hypothetical protein
MSRNPTQTKTPGGQAGGLGIRTTDKTDTDTPKRRRKSLTPRQTRTVQRLLRGAVMREELDHVAGASNSPDIVGQLRRKGLDIPCEPVSKLDRDGRQCTPGRYSLAPESVQEALRLLGALDG